MCWVNPMGEFLVLGKGLYILTLSLFQQWNSISAVLERLGGAQDT